MGVSSGFGFSMRFNDMKYLGGGGGGREKILEIISQIDFINSLIPIYRQIFYANYPARMKFSFDPIILCALLYAISTPIAVFATCVAPNS